MKKKYSCEVDCANCAQKLEDALRKVDGVQDVTVNFIAQKLTLVADDDRFDEVLAAVVARAKKVESDIVIHTA